MQIDYLLKFPSKEVAIQFGAATGLAAQDENGIWHPSTATHDHAIFEIGAHNGSDYWILYRDLTGIPVPAGAEAFIYWCSDWRVLDENGLEVAIPYPNDKSLAPTVFWC
jgi:hypothetical protein